MPSIFRPITVGVLAVVSMLVLAYSLIIAGQILLGVLAVGFVWFVYLLYRLLTILARIATSLEQLVDQRAESDSEA